MSKARQIYEWLQEQLPDSQEGEVNGSEAIKGVCTWLSEFGLLDGAKEDVVSRLENHAVPIEDL